MARQRKRERYENPKQNVREAIKKMESDLAKKRNYIPEIGDRVHLLADRYIGGNAVKDKDRENGLFVLRYNEANGVVSLCHADGVFVDALLLKDISYWPDDDEEVEETVEEAVENVEETVSEPDGAEEVEEEEEELDEEEDWEEDEDDEEDDDFYADEDEFEEEEGVD